jgi:hypothetical protein
MQPSEAETVGAGADVQHAGFTLSLIPDPRGLADREHMDY